MGRGRNVKVSIKVDLAPLKAMRRDGPAVLAALDPAVRGAAERVVDVSKFLVPRGGAPNDPLDLYATSFVIGPEYNLRRLSTTWFAGYNHPAAIPIHDGWHWGARTTPPPEWMRTALAVSGVKRTARALVKKAVQSLLKKYSQE